MGKQSVTRGLMTLMLLGLQFSITGCLLTNDEKEALYTVVGNSPSNTNTPSPGSPLPLESKMCYTQEFRQPDAEIVRKIDILLVTDTSASLNEERGVIASEIGAFVNEIPSSVDYQVAILPAHGSRGSHAGKLYKYRNEPYVLKSREMSVNAISSSLINSLTHMANDYYSDGGEEGLYSLSRSLDNGMKTAMQAHGFMRDDAALAVIFIADENDICYRYPSHIQRVPDPDRLEAPAFNRDCANITPESVYEKLKTHMNGRPLLISGILYTTPGLPTYRGEDEVGYGYLDLIRLNNGLAIDLSGRRYHEGLREVGSLATKRLHLLSEFNLEHTDNIDPESLEVTIDGALVEASITDGKIKLGGELGTENSVIKALYCERPPSTHNPTPENPPSNPDPNNPNPPTNPPTNPNPNPNPNLPPGVIDDNNDGIDDITGEPIF